MKALVAAFEKEKALVVTFPIIMKLQTLQRFVCSSNGNAGAEATPALVLGAKWTWPGSNCLYVAKSAAAHHAIIFPVTRPARRLPDYYSINTS